MIRYKPYHYGAVALICSILLSSPPLADASVASGTPKVWGYGVKSCADFVVVSKGVEFGDKRHVVEHLRFREWLSGLITGLSLATGSNVLKGAEIQGAMRRLRLHCEEHPQDDFFQAVNSYLRMLDSGSE